MLQNLPLAHDFAMNEQIRQFLLTGAINFVAAIVILIIGWTIAGWLGAWTRRILGRSDRVDATLKPIIVSLVRYTVVAVTIIAVLQRFGVQTTSLIAVVGAAGLAVGLAIQGTLSNVAAGAMLLVLRPFRIGDYIEAGGQGGTVREIGLFTTVMTTADLIYVAMPNSQIFGGTIINYSRDPTRRLNFTVGIDYADDIDKAQAIIVDVLKADSHVLENPAPMAPVGALGASSVDIIVRCWVPTSAYWDALFDLQKKVKQALDAGGITIPFPQQTLSMRPDAVVKTGPADAGAGAAGNTSS